MAKIINLILICNVVFAASCQLIDICEHTGGKRTFYHCVYKINTNQKHSVEEKGNE
jgi:hypothetical protein